MSEESQYTAGVPLYLEKSRYPVLSRYRDLIGLVKNAFSDDKITERELAEIEMINSDILLEYLTAAEVYNQLNEGTPERVAALRLLQHMHRCNVIMTFARDRARLKREETIEEGAANDAVEGVNSPKKAKKTLVLANYKSYPRTVNDKTIVIPAGLAGAEMVAQLAESDVMRIEAMMPDISKQLASVPQERREEAQGLIMMALKEICQIERIQDDRLSELINKIILEKYGNVILENEG